MRMNGVTTKESLAPRVQFRGGRMLRIYGNLVLQPVSDRQSYRQNFVLGR